MRQHQQFVNVMTVLLVVMWIISAIARIWIKWPEVAVLDSAMPSVIGYWFATNAVAGVKGSSNGKQQEKTA